MTGTAITEQSKMSLAREMLEKLIDRRVLAALEVCVRCGICTESCHYYQSNPKIEHTPYYRAEQVRRVLLQARRDLAAMLAGNRPLPVSCVDHPEF